MLSDDLQFASKQVYNPNMPEPVKVYVVDEEPILAMSLVAILNASGFRATAITNAEVAIDKIG